jgi:hypothetical protein
MTILAGAARAQTTDVALGIEALARRDVIGAEAAFRRGTTADNPLIRPAAWQWLGHIAWKFRADTAAAIRYLDRALAGARDSSQILLEIARLDAMRGRHREAFHEAFEAMQRSGDGERRGIAARATADLAVDALFAATSWPFAGDETTLGELRDTLASRVGRFYGRTRDARALMKVAALLRDTTALAAATRSYFALVEPSLRPSLDSMMRGLSPAMTGGLFEQIALYVERDRRLGARHVSPPGDLFTYGHFLHDLRGGIENLYRREVSGKARPGDVTRFLNGALHSLWREASWKQPKFFPAEVSREIAKRYGAVMSVERSRGLDELYFAHHLGTYRLDGAPVVVLDGAIADGIDDWFLDGTGGRAGWVANDTIYERRTAFTEAPFRAFLALTDPQTIPGELFRIGRDSVGDIERARTDSLGYFPGVAARIFRSGAQAVLDSVRTPDAFIRAMFDNLTRATIELHEGRHRADARARRTQSAADAEFRAKLDEVTGAPLPRLALTAILSPTIGDDSPHGQANRRIMIGLNRWIRRNGGSIARYDARMPALLQLPLLTDAQLRAAFRSMRGR